MVQPVPVALTTLATLALFAGAVLPIRAASEGERVREWLRRARALVSEFNERVVPVTRRRLRPRNAGSGWSAMLAQPIDADSVAARAEALRDVVAAGDANAGAILAAAAREEDGELRLAALRGLMLHRHQEGRDVFCEALRTGTDAERSLALDGLARLGDREALTTAFDDRLEPLAAKAVLLYAGGGERERALALLDERVGGTRREAIRALLAGVWE